MSEPAFNVGDTSWIGIRPLPRAEANKLQDALAAVYPASNWMDEFCKPEYQCLPCGGWGSTERGLFRAGHTINVSCRYCRGTGWRNGVYPA